MPTLTATDRFLDELRAEAALTRRLFERLPEQHLSWKPHWKSLSLGQLASHIAVLPWRIPELLTKLTVEAPDVPYPQAQTRDEVLGHSSAASSSRSKSWRTGETTASTPSGS